MTTSYSAAVCGDLEKQFSSYRLHRPLKVGHYDEGRQLTYTMTTVDAPARNVSMTLEIQRFVGGGFAGQVYKVTLLNIDADSTPGMAAGNTCAMKIFIPPSGFSRIFRNLLFTIGFQGSFQLQTNPAAARCGALWQKLIQRGAASRFGDGASVNTVRATFVDSVLGSCGELSDWVEGRTWQLEVDDRMDLLSKWDRGRTVDSVKLGSPEYRAKKDFMHRFVALLHEMGAHEFARQYEWSTWKSQPNCLKLLSTDRTPEKGLVAVDFRAGLALLPFLPMSPGDLKLIFQGLVRGSLVQFDRGNLATLKSFINAHKDSFNDLIPLVEELEENERIYRDSLPDITHNHIRLLFSRRLWATMTGSAITGWRVRNRIDEEFERHLKKYPPLMVIFWLIGLLPFLGSICHKYIGHRAWRRHYVGLLTSPSYFIRALKGKMAEKAIAWHRDERLTEAAAIQVAGSIGLFFLHLPFSLLPPALHKFLTCWSYFKERIDYIAARPFRLFFNAALREEWLREMVNDGLRKRMLTEDDAREISNQLKEAFIQKYLQSLAVHVMTLPITQVVSVSIAAMYVLTHPELSWQEASATALVIIGAFQVIPISPGSLARGLYVLWLVIRERNLKDYNIAVILGFFKYVGYLAFPIQMTYRYPTIARFMAAHWATEAVHVIPVFGESGALLEHKIFGLFYNWPLTIRRRMKRRAELRKTMRSLWWHTVPLTLGAAGVLYGIDRWYLRFNDTIPGFKGVVSLTFSGIRRLISLLSGLKLPAPEQLAAIIHYVPFCAATLIGGLTGALITFGCRGARLNRRIMLSALAGVVTGLLYTALAGLLSPRSGAPVEPFDLVTGGVWKMFGYTIATTVGAIITELSLPEPRESQSPYT
ncbi:MAG: hypothetical protein JXA18_13970 [Chitinispirillaceae bacterium]|nr:hypothetical protein [Chitinispirillaceae bacterium]